MVFCFKNCSDLLWKKCSSDREKLLRIEAEGQEFAKSFEITRTWNSERSEQFLKQNAFLTCSWRFLRSYVRKIGIGRKC